MKGFINAVDNFCAAVRAGARIHVQLRTLGFILHKAIKVNGHEVVIHDDLAVTVGIPLHHFNVVVTPTGKIITNNEFLNAPLTVQQAIVEHEIGHIKCGHLEKPKSKLFFLNLMRSWGGDVSHREIQADIYSEEQGYDMIGAIRWMREKYPWPRPAHNEFDIRIEAILKYRIEKEINASE